MLAEYLFTFCVNNWSYFDIHGEKKVEQCIEVVVRHIMNSTDDRFSSFMDKVIDELKEEI